MNELLQNYNSSVDDESDDLLDNELDEILDSNINNTVADWIIDIDKEATKTAESNDDGDRDNVLENRPFAKHFIRLCKMLPLWSGISNQFFHSPNVVGSSWSSETNFKNVKQLHEGKIPCGVDEFLKRDIQLVNSGVIIASRRYISTKKISKSTTKIPEVENEHCTPDELSQSQTISEMNFEEYWQRKKENTPSKIPLFHGSTSVSNTPLPKRKKLTMNENEPIETTKKCIACSQGDFPTGLHKCIICMKPVHLFDGCSESIGDEEGCGEERKCIECVNKTQSKQQTSQIKPKSKGIKSSKYMKTNPNWNLCSIPNKFKIAHLSNGSLSKTMSTVKGEKIMLTNTCAFDSITQLLAAAYTCFPSYKLFADKTNDEIFGFVKLLATKYVKLLHIFCSYVNLLNKYLFLQRIYAKDKYSTGTADQWQI